jgi:hypothetical protein
MSINKYQPHVFVLPEDDANRQLVNGFLLGPDLFVRRIQLLRVAGGWTRVRDCFASDHVAAMRRNENRFMVLLVDFDGDIGRLKAVKAAIPEDLTERVFVLGALKQPEALRQAGLGSYEAIGMAMANDCRSGTQLVWAHEQLRHNEGELARLRQAVCGFLFNSQREPAP